MGKVISIYPANDFDHVLETCRTNIECGIIIGYDEDGELVVYAGGMLDGRQPKSSDWLWMVQTFTKKLLDGDYAEE